jgi:hypothetical protein
MEECRSVTDIAQSIQSGMIDIGIAAGVSPSLHS